MWKQRLVNTEGWLDTILPSWTFDFWLFARCMNTTEAQPLHRKREALPLGEDCVNQVSTQAYLLSPLLTKYHWKTSFWRSAANKQNNSGENITVVAKETSATSSEYLVHKCSHKWHLCEALSGTLLGSIYSDWEKVELKLQVALPVLYVYVLKIAHGCLKMREWASEQVLYVSF